MVDSDHFNCHPVIVYSLADVPPLLRANVRPDSPLFRCCFFFALAGPTIVAGISQAFARLPEPPCDDVDEGLRISQAVQAALRETRVGAVLFGMRSAEAKVSSKVKCGFHTGEAAPFRRALEEAGLTLVEGAEVFRGLLRFLASDTPIVLRRNHEHTLIFDLPHTVIEPREPGTPGLFAIMSPPTEWKCTLLGIDGGALDLADVPLDANQPLRLEPPPTTPADGGDDSPELDDLADIAPRRVSALLAGNDPAGEAGEALMRSIVEHAVKLGPDRVRAAVRLWVRFLLSDQVTGRVGRFGDALVAGLSPVVGDACVRGIVVDEGRALRGERPRSTLEIWIETSMALVMADPDTDAERSDPGETAAHLESTLDGLVERLRNAGMPLDRARMVLDAAWAAQHLDGVLRGFGFEKHGDTYQHASGVRGTTFVDVQRGRAYLEASGGEEGLAAGFLTCVLELQPGPSHAARARRDVRRRPRARALAARRCRTPPGARRVRAALVLPLGGRRGHRRRGCARGPRALRERLIHRGKLHWSAWQRVGSRHAEPSRRFHSSDTTLLTRR